MFKNKVPFNEEVYDKIKYTIEQLSIRMKGKEPLSKETVELLESYIEEILDDASKYGPPTRPEPSLQPPSDEEH